MMKIQKYTVPVHGVGYLCENIKNRVLVSQVKAVFFVVIRVILHDLGWGCPF